MHHLSISGALAFCLLASACVGAVGSGDGAGASTHRDADAVLLPFTSLPLTDAPDEPGVVPFTSADDFRDFFGRDATDVAFDDEWVVFFGADDQRSTTCASIAAIEYSATTRRLRVVTKLERCADNGGLPRPSALVKFRVPSPEPLYFDFSHGGAGGGGTSTGADTCPDRTGGALVTVEVGYEDPERFSAWVTSPSFIADAKELLASGDRRNPTFRIVDEAGCDGQWSFSVAPDAHFAEISIELCDAMPSYINDNKSEWVGQLWCPWGARVVEVDER